jgi:hypothetical protein
MPPSSIGTCYLRTVRTASLRMAGVSDFVDVIPRPAPGRSRPGGPRGPDGLCVLRRFGALASLVAASAARCVLVLSGRPASATQRR